jgi:hypothetical protein
VPRETLKILFHVGVCAFLAGGCASAQPPFQPSIGSAEFQEYCRDALRRDPSNSDNERYAFFLLAYAGDPDGLRSYFAEATFDVPDKRWKDYNSWSLETFLAKLGDKRFAAALSKEEPRVQRAVLERMDPKFISQYPKTYQLLDRSRRSVSWVGLPLSAR